MDKKPAMLRALLFISLIITAFLVRVNAQSPNTPIYGWKMDERSGQYTFTPVTLIGTPNFHYDIYPPEKSADDVAGWLSAKVEKDVQAAGYTLMPGESKAQNVKSFRIYSVLVRDAAGKTWLLNYMAYSRPDHSIRYGRITEVPNSAISKNNMNTAVQHFLRLSQREGILTDNGSSSSSGNSGSSAGTNRRPETPTTPPGEGLKPADIKGIVLHQEYGFGVGGMMIINYNPYLLLKDGTIYSDPYVCAYDLDVMRSRQLEPKKWGSWKQEGAETLIVTMNSNNKSEKWEGKAHWFWATPAKPNQRLRGTWSTIGGGGNTAMGGGSIVVSSNALTFNDQGQFTTLSTGGGTFSGATGTVSAYSNKDGAGTYTFNGWSLELKYNNGKIVRKNFCFYGDKDQDVWVFGTSAYTPSDSNKKK